MNQMILTTMNASTAVAAGGAIPLGNAIHGCGKDIVLFNNGITIRDKGYYEFIINVSANITGTDDASLTLYDNGVAIPAATATATPASAGAAVNLSIPWVYRKGCCCDDTSLTAVLSVAGTVTDVVCVVKKL